jgi:hypothetical protein
MHPSFSWPLVFVALTWFAAQPVLATVDDTLEQIEDAGSDPLKVGIPSLKKVKFPPVRLKIDEEIEWGDFQGTDVTTFRTRLVGEMILPFSKRFVTALSASGAITLTDFNGGGNFVESGRASGDPWDNLNEFGVRYRGLFQFNDSWGVMAAAWTSARFEDGAAPKDGLKGAGATAITYRFGDRITITVGVAVGSRIVGSPVSVNPFGAISWNINDVHRLSTSGLGARLRSRWNKKLTTFLYGRMKGRRWRLDDRGDGLVNKGSLRDRKAPIGIGVQWKFMKGWRLRSDFGLVVFRELKVTDEDGDSVDTETSDAPGVFGSLMFQWRF